MINVEVLKPDSPMQFRVTIQDGGSETQHRVSMDDDTLRRLCAGKASATACVEAAFRFLLAREPKEAILSSFDMTVISQYFPEFESSLPDYLN